MYGARHLKRYQYDIVEMFEQGEVSSSHKLGPARMYKLLVIKYPKRYDLPSENDIRAKILKLTRATKRLDGILETQSMQKESNARLLIYISSDSRCRRSILRT